MIRRKPSADSITKNVEAAFKQASRKVIEIARQTNTPIIVWDKGKVVSISAEDAEKSQQ
jgi:hypothetical protein